MVEAVPDRLTNARSLFASTQRSLARLFDRYSDRDLSVIADFLDHNAERLRAETTKLGRLMLTTRTLNRLALVATIAVGLACDDDDPTGPGSVTFPDWPSTVVAAFCVRGTAVIGDTKSSTISDTDCDVADVDPSDQGYYEVWRVRVASSRDVTFDANSTFDNFLAIVRVNSVTATNLDVAVVGENDDRSFPSNLNALVTVRLEPNVDYAVAISGIDYTETGPYTLAIR